MIHQNEWSMKSTCFILNTFETIYFSFRARIFIRDGHMTLMGAYNKHIHIKTIGGGSVYLNEQDISQLTLLVFNFIFSLMKNT